jgi:hypothetical protein
MTKTQNKKQRKKQTKYEVKPLEFSWWSWDFNHWNNKIHITNMKTMRWYSNLEWKQWNVLMKLQLLKNN